MSKHKGHKNFVTVVSNIDAGELLEVVDSHKQEDIIEILMQQTLEVGRIAWLGGDLLKNKGAPASAP